VYDDSSTDGLAAALAPFVDAGVVELHDAPQPPYSFRGMPSLGPQFSAYDDCLTRAAPGREWVALFDNDEFPMLTKHACLTDFVVDAVAAAGTRRGPRRRIGPVGAVGAVALPWAVVGHSRQMRDTARSQLEMTGFSMGVADPSQHIKSIVRSHLVLSMDNAHVAGMIGGAATVFITGEEAAGNGVHTHPPDRAVDLGRLLHYMTRSFASFLQRHVDGRADLRTGAATATVLPRQAFDAWGSAAERPFTAVPCPHDSPMRRTHALLVAAMGLEHWRATASNATVQWRSEHDGRGAQLAAHEFRWARCCR
jgi:hypothetical protein